MDVHEWLARLLSRAPADPLDWERYQVTMERTTWQALWREIAATEAYDDGVELALRLLLATQQHRQRLSVREYEGRRILLYRAVLTMLEKAERWEAYVAAWDAIRAQTTECVPQRGDALREEGPRLAPFVRRPDGGFGVSPPTYGSPPPPATIAVHFLYPQLPRKTRIERRLSHARSGAAAGTHALTTEGLQARLAQIGDSRA